jgi:hypothetical protein
MHQLGTRPIEDHDVETTTVTTDEVEPIIVALAVVDEPNEFDQNSNKKLLVFVA